MSDIPDDIPPPPDESYLNYEPVLDIGSFSNLNKNDPVNSPKRTGRKVDNKDLPDKPEYRGNQIIPATIENLEVILHKEGFRIRYHLDKKKVEIEAPGDAPTDDNRDNVGLTKILSVAARYGLATGHIPAYVEVIADKHA